MMPCLVDVLVLVDTCKIHAFLGGKTRLIYPCVHQIMVLTKGNLHACTPGGMHLFMLVDALLWLHRAGKAGWHQKLVQDMIQAVKLGTASLCIVPPQ